MPLPVVRPLSPAALLRRARAARALRGGAALALLAVAREAEAEAARGVEPAANRRAALALRAKVAASAFLWGGGA